MRASPPERYEEISQRFLEQAREELDKNDVLQAAEKVWGATAHAIKAVAQARGWNHRYHNHPREAVIYIAMERNVNDYLRGLFATLNALHDNFYEHQLYPSEVKLAINDAVAFTRGMQNARLAGLPEEQSHLSPDARRDQERRLNLLTLKIAHAPGDECTGDELAALPPVQPVAPGHKPAG